MDINKLNSIENKIKKYKKKQEQIELIRIFLGNLKDSERLDLSSEWGTAPTRSNLTKFNDLKMERSEVYELIGKEIENLLEKKMIEIKNEIEEISIEDLLK